MTDAADANDPLAALEEFASALAHGDANTPPAPTTGESGLRAGWRGVADCVRELAGLWPRPAAGPERAGDPVRLGRFEVAGPLGRGGFGLVLLATDPLLGRTVAVKVPRPDVPLTATLRRRFVREGRAAAGLDHPNIVGVYEAGEVGPVPYIAAAYVSGPTLAAWLRASLHAIPPVDAAQATAALADAIAHAHVRGVLHRDLKPGNVLLHPTDPGGDPPSVRPLSAFTPKVCDFGLALLAGEVGDTRTGAFLGTPAYTAPEQARGGASAAGPAADMYGLGAILYEVLTGRPPFRGASDADTLRQVVADDPVPPRRLRADVPPDLEAVCLTCLAKDPARRYPSAAALATDLRRFLAGKPTAVRPVGPFGRAARWARRNPAGAALVALAAVSLAAGGAGLAAHAHRLQGANDALAAVNADLRTEKDRVADRNRTLRRIGYADGIRRAARLLEANDHAGIRRALDELRPTAAEEDLREWCWHYLGNQAEGRRLTLTGHTGAVYRAAFSPDGGTLATAGQDRTVRLWDLATGDCRRVLTGHTDEVNAVAYSPDGRRLATAGDDAAVRLWDPATGACVRVIAGHPQPMHKVRFTPDGRRVAAIDRAGGLRVWPADGGPVQVAVPLTAADPAEIGGVAIGTRDGRLVSLLATHDRHVVEHDVLTGAQVARWYVGWDLRSLALSPDGTVFAGGTPEGDVGVWTAREAEPYARWENGSDRTQELAISPDGELLAAARKDGAVGLFHALTGRRLATLPAHAARGWGAAFSPDGRTLVTTDAAGVVHVWDVKEVRRRGPLVTGFHVSALAFVGTSHWLVGADASGLTVFDWPAAGEVNFTHIGPDRRGGRVAACLDGAHVFTDAGGRVRRWSVPALRPAGDSGLAPSELVALTRTGDWCLVGSADGRIHRWRPPGPPEPLFTVPPDIRGAGVLSPDDRILAIPVGTGVHLMDASTGAKVGRLDGPRLAVRALAFSPDGSLLAVGSNDTTVAVWDWRARWVVHSLVGHRSAVLAVAFAPDGRSVVASGADGTTRVWHAGTGGELLVFNDGFPAQGLAFSPDGRVLATGGMMGPTTGAARVRLAGPP